MTHAEHDDSVQMEMQGIAVREICAVSSTDTLSALRSAVIDAARRWYRSTNEAELASAVRELESEMKRLARVAVTLELTP